MTAPSLLSHAADAIAAYADDLHVAHRIAPEDLSALAAELHAAAVSAAEPLMPSKQWLERAKVLVSGFETAVLDCCKDGMSDQSQRAVENEADRAHADLLYHLDARIAATLVWPRERTEGRAAGAVQ